MSYSQNTITDANAANVYAGILTGLLIDAGWTLVETITPTAGQQTNVYKSAGTDNQAGYDWYIGITWTLTGTENTVRIIAGGAYDAVNHRLSQIPGGLTANGNGNPSPDPVTGDVMGYFNYAVGASFAPVDPNGTWQLSKVGSFNNAGAPWHQFIVPSSAFGYWASVTLDHFTVFTTVPQTFPQGGAQGNGMFHVGTMQLDAAYEALSWTAKNPLMALAPAYIINWGVGPTIIPTSDEAGARQVQAVATQNYGAKLPLLSDEYFPAFAWKPGIYVNNVGGSGGTPPYLGTAFDDGLLIGQGIDWYSVFGGSIGDTVEIDGSTYVLTGPVGTTSPNHTTQCVAVLVES